MVFSQMDVDNYHISAGAIEAHPDDGFLASVVVALTEKGGATAEVFRDAGISGGHHWESSDAAISAALAMGLMVVQHDELLHPGAG